MWLLVMFDLPVTTKDARSRATRFRTFLLRDGYFRLQWSVYARICNGYERRDKHLKRLKKSLPPKGSVKALEVTDRQFSNMMMLVSTEKEKEPPAHLGPTEQLLLF